MAGSLEKVVDEFAFKEFLPAGEPSPKQNAVIFLHAMLCSKEIWVNIPQDVANKTNRKVYTYDARNHGRNKHTEDYTFDMNVSDLFRFMAGQNLQEVVLVGHDMGAITAIRAALEKPKSVEMVFIIDMHTNKLSDTLIDESIEFMKAWPEALKTVSEDTPVDEVTKIVVPILFAKLPQSEEKRREQEVEKPAYMKAKFDYDKTDEGYKVLFNEGALAKALAELKESQKEYKGVYDKPAYFFYGTESHYRVGSENENIKKHFPEAKMVKFDGAPHFLFVLFPDKFIDDLASRMTHS